MREIKFRAWDTDNQKMYYSDREEENGGGLIIWNMNNGIQFEEIQLIDTNPGGMGHEQNYKYRAPNQILMQYTGLKDKNDKEIYFYDVLKVTIFCDITGEENSFKGIIYFHPKRLRVCIKGYENFDLIFADEIEIIGNIHENPELLK